MSRRMRGRPGAGLGAVAAALVVAVVVAVAAPAGAAVGAGAAAGARAAVAGPPFSVARQANATGGAQVFRVRTGNDGAFDRVVFDARGGLPAYDAAYVAQVLRDGSGQPVVMRGHYYLRLVLPGSWTGATSWTDPSLVPPVIDTPGLSEVKQIQLVGEFENVTTFAIGLDRYRGFRVLRLTGPDRLVVDVLH